MDTTTREALRDLLGSEKEWLKEEIEEEHEDNPFFRNGTNYEIDCSMVNHQSFYDELYSKIYELDDYKKLMEEQKEDYIDLVNEYIYQCVKEIIENEESDVE